LCNVSTDITDWAGNIAAEPKAPSRLTESRPGSVSESRKAESQGRRDAALSLGLSVTVLVVEDDRCVRELVALVLRELGYNVILARDGEEAERLMAGQPRIDVVLTDMNLPRMSGLDFIKRTQGGNPQTKFILSSGVNQSRVPGVTFLRKPYEIGDL